MAIPLLAAAGPLSVAIRKVLKSVVSMSWGRMLKPSYAVYGRVVDDRSVGRNESNEPGVFHPAAFRRSVGEEHPLRQFGFLRERDLVVGRGEPLHHLRDVVNGIRRGFVFGDVGECLVEVRHRESILEGGQRLEGKIIGRTHLGQLGGEHRLVEDGGLAMSRHRDTRRLDVDVPALPNQAPFETRLRRCGPLRSTED